MSRTREEWAREMRLRRAADRQGLALHKSRRRDPRALDYGRWRIVDERNYAVATDLTLEGVEAFLNGPKRSEPLHPTTDPRTDQEEQRHE